ncbi:MAG: chorismate mutase [Chitinispirillaceae bacterium]|jgi:chorismate mutase|nr:chorismate mutase [Chitinispirillaceae bacterium]
MGKNKRSDKTAFEVETIAARLEGLEETIIGKLIDRAQFCANTRIYEPGKSGFTGEKNRSLLEVRLLHQERIDSLFGRFSVPEERPCFPRLPKAKRRAFIPDTGLHIADFDLVNQTALIVQRYLALVPQICPSGDDGHYGSSVEHDVMAIQAIARRVHYGSLYIAESKFIASPDVFMPLVKDGDIRGIIERLTRKEVEARIIRRIAEKTAAAQSTINTKVRHRIDPALVASFYRDTIVPMTKSGEAQYLMHRINRKQP